MPIGCRAPRHARRSSCCTIFSLGSTRAGSRDVASKESGRPREPAPSLAGPPLAKRRPRLPAVRLSFLNFFSSPEEVVKLGGLCDDLACVARFWIGEHHSGTQVAD